MILLIFSLACGSVTVDDAGVEVDGGSDVDTDTDTDLDAGGVDGGGDTDADTDADTDTDSDADSDSNTDTSTEDADAGPPCAGWIDPELGGCWYLSARGAGESCNDTCAAHGGYDAVNSTHIGIGIGHHFFPDPDYNEAGGGQSPIEQIIHCGGGGEVFIYAADGNPPDGNYTNALGCSQLACSCFE